MQSHIAEGKLRIIQEQVPGRQVTLAHIIANPDPAVSEKLCGMQAAEGFAAMGILSVTPAEISVIAADLAAKSANVLLQSVDVQNGTLFFAGKVAEVQTALGRILGYLEEEMDFEVCRVTRT
ncbi:MAG: BMC domain-containing protein [Clostridiales bacterium]|jgi:ethanolamine utilization protein EutS|nr:BMC domain-containing protein [Clostridiales bacterium]